MLRDPGLRVFARLMFGGIVLTFAIGCASFFLGCRHQPPAPPAPPPVRAVAVWAPGVPTPLVYLDQIGTTTGDANGYAVFARVPEALTVVPYLTITAEGYRPYRVDNVLLKPGNYQMNVGYELPPMVKVHGHTGEAGPIRVSGAEFVTEGGAIWHARSATAFLLFDRYQKGEHIEPQLQWYVDHGRNMVRVFVVWAPRSPNPDLSKLPAFLDLCAEYGVRVELSVVTGDNRTFEEWRQTIQQVYNAANGRWNTFVTTVNEPWNGWASQLDPQRLMQGISRYGIPSAYGYAPEPRLGTEDYQAGPALDYVTWHSPRDVHFPHNGKDALGIRAAYGRPVIDDEPLGYANFDRQGGGARTTDGMLMAAHMGTCAVFANGCTWHFESGLSGLAPVAGTIEEAISVRLQAVATFYPANTHTGRYTRFGLGDYALGWSTGSRTNHAYGSILGNTQWVVVPYPNPGWQPQPVGGWRVDALGPETGMLRMIK